MKYEAMQKQLNWKKRDEKGDRHREGAQIYPRKTCLKGEPSVVPTCGR